MSVVACMHGLWGSRQSLKIWNRALYQLSDLSRSSSACRWFLLEVKDVKRDKALTSSSMFEMSRDMLERREDQI
jgi:hypothetical protein